MSEDELPDPINFEEELKRYRRANPFLAFEVILTSGDRIFVNDPERMAFTSNVLVWADRMKGIGIYRKNQIVSFEAREPE